MKSPVRHSIYRRTQALLLCLAVSLTPALQAAQQSKSAKRPLNQINPAFVITPKEAKEWHALKDKLGPALSGNPSWRNYMEFVEKKLKEYGAVDITRNSWTYERWHTSEWPDDSKWSLVSGSRKIKVASYGCYSGSTPEDGVTAELIHYDAASPPKDIAGKIVIFQPRFSREMQENIYGNDFEYPATEDSWPRPGKPIPPDLNLKAAASRIWAQLPQTGGFIRTAVQGKAAGIVFVFDAGYDLMSGVYTFGVPQLYNAPTLYLDREAGAQVIADAKKGAKATIRLRAEVTPTETWQLISYLPGKNYGAPNDEMIMFSTHSDGPSISQDNGPFGLLAIAKYFSNIPQSERPRTIMFFMDNRHYMPGAERAFAQQDWLARNPSYKDKVAAVLGMEHLGQIEFREEGARLIPSGRTDLHNLWVTNNDRMVAMANKAVTDNKLNGAFIRVPARNGKSGRPQGPWYGLGGLANRINKPGFSTMGSMGAYWATSSGLDRFDANHFCRQVATFAQLTGELMLADMKELQSAPSERTVMPRVSEGGVPPGANISASPANNLAPATRTAAGNPPAASAGFRQLMKDRLPTRFHSLPLAVLTMGNA